MEEILHVWLDRKKIHFSKDCSLLKPIDIYIGFFLL